MFRRVLRCVGGCLLFAASTAYAHGVVGQRSFIEPFVTEDVNPKNEFVIARPEWVHAREGNAFSLGFGLEKKLADELSITLDSAWNLIDPSDPEESQATGFDNLGITLKYAFYINPEHETIFSAAVESTAPVGNTDAGAEPDWSFKPFLLYGKGFGDLPQAVKYLRPMAVQGDAGFEISLDHDRTTVLQYNFCFQYSVPYLQAYVRDIGLGWPLNDLLPVWEFNFDTGVHGEEAGDTSVITTPGFVYMDRYVEVGVAGRFPLNGVAHQEISWGVIGIIDLFIDDIIPATKWQPF